MELRLGKVFGIPVVLNDNFLIFFGLMVLFKLFFSGLAVAFLTAQAIIAISIIVLLHEFGHALTAKYFGVRTTSISLHFFGGVAAGDSQDWPKLYAKPYKGLLVWAAGPAVNVVLYFLLCLLVPLFRGNTTLSQDLAFLIFINLSLAVFNLLPFFPMDGGRILHSLLSMTMSARKASKVAAVVGFIGAVLFVAGAIYLKAIMLGVVAVIVFMGSRQLYHNKSI